MSGFRIDIEAKTHENENFREVLCTGPYSQLVVMTLKPGEEIGLETHPDRDQFIRVEEGSGEAIVDGERHSLVDGIAVVIPAGARHNIVNTSSLDSLRLYTVYSPPEHPDRTVHRTKQEADAYERTHHRR